jgi:HK97 family phage major capsid protein
MNPEQIRQRLAEIAASIEGIQASDEGYSDEQLAQIETLNTEFGTLEKQLQAAEQAEAIKAKATASQGRKTEPAKTTPNIQVGKDLSARFGGFGSAGEFVMAVKKAGRGEIDKRFNSGMYEKSGEDGGFLEPEEMSSEIIKKLNGDGSLMASTKQIQVSGNNLTLKVDEAQPWNGGVQAYWTEEGGTISQSKPKFKQPAFRLHKLAALVLATDELLDDATALGSYIQASAPEAIMHAVNKAILTGTGVGKPEGIINSPFTVTVSKESMQANDTINAKNVVKMYNRLFPLSRARAAWYVNPGCEDQLRLMKDDNDNYIYLAPGSQLNQGPYATLLGRPVIPLMGGIPALGDKGDIIFADLSYYYMILKAGGIKSATSIHMKFDTEETAFRFSMRIDGKAPFTSPVTTEFGSYQMSAFSVLEAR